MNWRHVTSLEALTQKGSMVFKEASKSIAVFYLNEEVHALDNRCPHEGYPLKQGTVNGKDCTLTCQWHNWKFNLKSGVALQGEDAVRVYKTKIDGDELYVDISEETLEEKTNKILRGLREAVNERQYGRLTREITRLELAGIDPMVAVRDTVERTYEMFEYGMNHAFAGLLDWMELADHHGDDHEARIICFAEALDHIAHDTLMHLHFPFTKESRPFHGPDFLRAVESQNETAAVAMINGAIETETPWADLEIWFSRAALAHYNSFGHSIIYTSKMGALLERLGADCAKYLLPNLTRQLVMATREDLIPDFKEYAPSLKQTEVAGGVQNTADSLPLFGLGVKGALNWVTRALTQFTVEATYQALLEANARNLLHFDLAHDNSFEAPVSRTASWLDTTHGVTMSSAVRRQSEKFPELWPAGLLQLACFVGRNRNYLDQAMDTTPWQLEAESQFWEDCFGKLLDHGLNEPIYAVHLLKTTLAVQLEADVVGTSCKQTLLQALNRFLNSPIKQKHARRLARQAITLVSKG